MTIPGTDDCEDVGSTLRVQEPATGTGNEKAATSTKGWCLSGVAEYYWNTWLFVPCIVCLDIGVVISIGLS